MDWDDQAIVLGVVGHGEAGAILDCLSEAHGRYKGYVRGGRGRRQRGALQPGNVVRARWRARVAEHLGTFSVELTRSPLGRILDDADRLLALSSACSLVAAGLPEREAHAPVFHGLAAFLDLVSDAELPLAGWSAGLVKFEVGLLQELGYGLDLTSCAATGVTEDLVYVSPKTGRAVSREAGAPYKDKLLPLPGFLADPETGAEEEDIVAALDLTGFFLGRHVLAATGGTLPQARDRLVARLKKKHANTNI